jgi:hypothetical protein
MIDLGVTHSQQLNPVAKAIRTRLNSDDYFVVIQGRKVTIYPHNHREPFVTKISEDVEQWLENYNGTKPVRPREFVLALPVEFIASE